MPRVRVHDAHRLLLVVDTGQESTEPMIDVPGEVCAPDKARKRERGQRHGSEVNVKVMRQFECGAQRHETRVH